MIVWEIPVGLEATITYGSSVSCIMHVLIGVNAVVAQTNLRNNRTAFHTKVPTTIITK